MIYDYFILSIFATFGLHCDYKIISFSKSRFQKPFFNLHQILKIRQIQTLSEFFGKLKGAKNNFPKYKEIASGKTRELPQNKRNTSFSPEISMNFSVDITNSSLPVRRK